MRLRQMMGLHKMHARMPSVHAVPIHATRMQQAHQSSRTARRGPGHFPQRVGWL